MLINLLAQYSTLWKRSFDYSEKLFVSCTSIHCNLFAFFHIMLFIIYNFTILVCIGYTVFALLKTSNEHLKDICHRSNAWECVAVHLVMLCMCVLYFTYHHKIKIFKNKATRKGGNRHHQQQQNDDRQFILSLLHYGMTSWGVYELWGVSCVNHLCNELLYSVLQFYVIMDLIVLCFLVFSTSRDVIAAI